MRRRLGRYCQTHGHNLNSEKVMVFITLLHCRLQRKLILVLDRYSVHRRAVRLTQAKHPDWFEAEWLPAYAPELNAVEMLWNHTKCGDLVNFIPEDVNDLHQSVAVSISDTHTQTRLLHSFFQYAKLELWSFLSFYETQ